MQYVLMIREAPSDFEQRKGPEAPAYWGAWTAYGQALAAAGVMVGGNGLEAPHTTTIVRVRDGQRHVQDGPFADAKEQLGGYFVIEVPDLDRALDWAARVPVSEHGSVEVRPVLSMGPPA